MQTNQGIQLVRVDQKVTLPFGIVLVNGYQPIPVTNVTSSPSYLYEVTYDIKELLNLKIELYTKEPIEVKIRWNVVQQYGLEEWTQEVILTDKAPEHYLFLYTKNSVYPWRVGVYHFEVIYEDQRYFGGIRVLPKNVDERQFKHIHEVINEKLESLASDYLSYKTTYGNLSEIEQTNFWNYYNWYKNIEQKLLTAIHHIEDSGVTELKKTYATETVPRQVDYKSIRWESSFPGNIFKGQKFYNKKMIPYLNHESNRLVKHRIYDILHQINENISYLKEFTDEVSDSFKEIKREIELLNKEFNGITSKFSIEKYKDKISKSIYGKEKDLNRVYKQLKELEDLTEEYHSFRRSLSAQVSTPFWRGISQHPSKRQIIPKHPSYHLFHEIWRDSNSMYTIKGEQQVPLSVLKPTYLLYEYYIFFITVEIMRDLNFEPYEDNLLNQITKSFYKEGLKEGTKVSFIQGDQRVDIVYDEMVEPNDNLAIGNGTHFYNNESKRRPDIRLDLYVADGDEWLFESCLIVEVKYRPLNNIYLKNGVTEVMNQLGNYNSISYVYHTPKGRKKYKRNVPEEVICICPDHSMEDILPTGYGTFIKLYPEITDDGSVITRGKITLQTQIVDWIGV